MEISNMAEVITKSREACLKYINPFKPDIWRDIPEEVRGKYGLHDIYLYSKDNYRRGVGYTFEAYGQKVFIPEKELAKKRLRITLGKPKNLPLALLVSFWDEDNVLEL